MHLLQIIERTNAFSKRYDIYIFFSNFLDLWQTTQYSFFMFLVIFLSMKIF